MTAVHLLLLVLFTLRAHSIALDLVASRTINSPLPVTTIHQFALGTWAESLAFRPDGHILVNILSSPDIYSVDPVSGKSMLVVSNPHITSFYGITQVEPDQFYVCGGNYSFETGVKQLGSYSVFHIDLDSFDASKPGSAVLEKVADFPLATLNGMTTLSTKKGLVLVADSTNGRIWKLNVNTGENSVAIQDPLLDIPANATTQLGVNGIEVRGSYVYFTNTGAGTFGKIPISATTGEQVGPGILLAQNPEGRGGDDFTIDGDGVAFVAENPNNWISIVEPGNSEPKRIAGGPNDSITIPGPTAAKFGPSSYDEKNKSLYVTFHGGIEQYSTGNFTIAGGVLRIDTARLQSEVQR